MPPIGPDGRPRRSGSATASSATPTGAAGARDAPSRGPTLRFARDARRLPRPARAMAADARRRAGAAGGRRSRCRPGATLDARRASRARAAHLPRRPRRLRRARRISAAASTFTLGGFGGHGGRALRAGDVLHVGAERRGRRAAPSALPAGARPASSATRGRSACSTARTARPTSSPPDDIDALLRHRVGGALQLGRTGVRLIGPQAGVGARRRRRGRAAPVEHPRQRRTPSARSTSPATCRSSSGPTARASAASSARRRSSSAELWKIGQLRAGRHACASCRVDRDEARAAPTPRRTRRSRRCAPAPPRRSRPRCAPGARPVLATLRRPRRPRRRSRTAAPATRYLLVEYGPMSLDLELRFRVHALMQRGWPSATLAGIVELTPGIRSLQVHFDPRELHARPAARRCSSRAEDELPRARRHRGAERASCTCRCRGTTRRRATRSSGTCTSVRDDAPWCP